MFRHRCAFCEYSEPCQWSLRKHFRLKHPGSALKVREFRDAEKDARVEKMIDECVIQLQQLANEELAAEADSSTWKAPGAMAQRGMRKRAGVSESPSSQNQPAFDHSRAPSPSRSSSSGQEILLPR